MVETKYKMGKFCIIEADVTIGNNVTILNYVHLRSGTVIGDNTFIDDYVASSGNNSIGKNCKIRYRVTIARNVIIENDVFISPNVMTVALDAAQKQGKPIRICKDAFIGTGAVIMPGVTIGEAAIVGALAVVTKDVAARDTVIGNPARSLRCKKAT